MIVGGVGLGICEPCRSPGAFWYPPVVHVLAGIWMCDSCVHPDLPRHRIWADIQRVRARIPAHADTATRHGIQCATPECELDANHPDHHEDRFGRTWRTYA